MPRGTHTALLSIRKWHYVAVHCVVDDDVLNTVIVCVYVCVCALDDRVTRNTMRKHSNKNPPSSRWTATPLCPLPKRGFWGGWWATIWRVTKCCRANVVVTHHKNVTVITEHRLAKFQLAHCFRYDSLSDALIAYNSPFGECFTRHERIFYLLFVQRQWSICEHNEAVGSIMCKRSLLFGRLGWNWF